MEPKAGLRAQRGQTLAERAWQAGSDLRPVYLGDALFSCQPLAEAVLATDADFLFVCKRDGHKTLYEYVDGATLDERTVTERKPGKRSQTYRYRWIQAVPLRDGKDALAVNWLGSPSPMTREKLRMTCFRDQLADRQTTWWRLRPARGPVGRSRTRASMC